MRGTVAAGLTAGSVLMVGALAVGGEAAGWVFAVLAVLFPLGLIALGTRESPALGRFLPVLGAILVASGLGVLALSRRPEGERFAGLPAGAWLMLVGLGLVPLVLVVWAHAATFRERPGGGSGEGADS